MKVYKGMKNLDNDETLLVFAEWLDRYRGAVFTEKTRDECVSVAHKFAEFIEPVPLYECTVAEINAFEQHAKKTYRRTSRDLLAPTMIGMAYFSSFREQVLKPFPPGRIPAAEARKFLARRSFSDAFANARNHQKSH